MTYSQSFAAMFGVVNTAWPAMSTYIGQSDLTINLIEQDKEPANPYNPDVYYGRFTMVGAQSPQTTFASQASNADRRRYTSSGSIFIQLFSPMVIATGADDCRLMGEYIQSILRKGVTDIRLQNVRIKELANDGTYFRRNVVADYFYDEII